MSPLEFKALEAAERLTPAKLAEARQLLTKVAGSDQMVPALPIASAASRLVDAVHTHLLQSFPTESARLIRAPPSEPPSRGAPVSESDVALSPSLVFPPSPGLVLPPQPSGVMEPVSEPRAAKAAPPPQTSMFRAKQGT